MMLEKTVKSTTEMALDRNDALTLSAITEDGQDLVPVYGAGYVGLKNMGNSCYMNSVLQVLMSMPEIRVRYIERAEAVFRSAPADPTEDWATQICKLGGSMLSERYSREGMDGEEGREEAGVEPRAFKALVGKGHPEFSSNKQQDAAEYMAEQLLEVMDRAERLCADRIGNPERPTSCLFKLSMEERTEAAGGGELAGQVQYKRQAGKTLDLFMPPRPAEQPAGEEQKTKAETKKQKTEEKELPPVDFAQCLAARWGRELVESVASCGGGSAYRSTSLATMPPYLMVKLNRFYMAADWSTKKDARECQFPEALSLEAVRGRGLQGSEQELPADAAAPAAAAAAAPPPPAAVEPDETIVAALLSMGFGENGCKKAALAVSNSSVEAASEWVFVHMEDANFNEPIQAAAADAPAAAAAAAGPDPEALMTLSSMGFDEAQAGAALTACSGNVERAADWLFSRTPEEIAAAIAEQNGAASAAAGGGGGGGGGGEAVLDDGAGEYELLGIISHMGANTGCGHYVAHVKKEGKWFLYNDRKVAESSAQPPKAISHVYLYIYKRQ